MRRFFLISVFSLSAFQLFAGTGAWIYGTNILGNNTAQTGIEVIFTPLSNHVVLPNGAYMRTYPITIITTNGGSIGSNFLVAGPWTVETPETADRFRIYVPSDDAAHDWVTLATAGSFNFVTNTGPPFIAVNQGSGISNRLVRPRLFAGGTTSSPTNPAGASNYVWSLTNIFTGEGEWRQSVAGTGDAGGTNARMFAISGVSSNQTLAGSNTITSSNWPGMVSNVVNILAFGADPSGVNDSRNAIQAAINSLGLGSGSGTILFPPGTYLVKSTITNYGLRDIHFLGSGSGTSVGTYSSSSSILYWSGATNGILWDIDRSDGLVFEKLHFHNPATNSAMILVRIDQTGPSAWGTMTDCEWLRCSFRNVNTSTAHKFFAVQISTNSASNCEDMRFRDCYFQGFGVDQNPATNTAYGVWIGANANAKNIRIESGKGKDFTNFVYLSNGGLVVRDLELTGNYANFVVLNNADPVIFEHNRSEVERQEAIINGGTEVRFIDNTFQDLTKWNTNFGLIEINSTTYLLMDNNRFSPVYDQPTFRVGASYAPSLYAVNNQWTTNDARANGLNGFTGGLVRKLNHGERDNATSLPLQFWPPTERQPSNYISWNTNAARQTVMIGEIGPGIAIGTNSANTYTFRVFEHETNVNVTVGVSYGDRTIDDRYTFGAAGSSAGDSQVKFRHGSGRSLYFDLINTSGIGGRLQATDSRLNIAFLGGSMTGGWQDNGGNDLATWNQNGLFQFNSNVYARAISYTDGSNARDANGNPYVTNGTASVSSQFIAALNGTGTNLGASHFTGSTNWPLVVRDTNGAALVGWDTNGNYRALANVTYDLFDASNYGRTGWIANVTASNILAQTQLGVGVTASQVIAPLTVSGAASFSGGTVTNGNSNEAERFTGTGANIVFSGPQDGARIIVTNSTSGGAFSTGTTNDQWTAGYAKDIASKPTNLLFLARDGTLKDANGNPYTTNALTRLYSAGNTNATAYSVVQNGTNTTGAAKTISAGSNITITENGSTNLSIASSGGSGSAASTWTNGVAVTASPTNNNFIAGYGLSVRGTNTSGNVDLCFSLLQSNTPTPQFRRAAWMYAQGPDSGSAQGLGLTPATLGSTTVSGKSPNATNGNCYMDQTPNTTSNTIAGHYASSGSAWTADSPYLTTRLSFTNVGNCKIRVGFSDAPSGSTQADIVPTDKTGAWFQLLAVSPTNDTKWQCVVANATGSTNYIVDSGVTATSAYTYFEILYVGTTSVKFAINGAQVANINVGCIPNGASKIQVPFLATWNGADTLNKAVLWSVLYQESDK